jgi:ComF family protein
MKSFLNITRIKDLFLNILFPSYCLGCGIKNEILCDYCVQKIKITERETSKDILAMFDYQDPLIKKTIWELKYHNKSYLGEKLGQLLYEFFIEDISEIKISTPGRPIFVIPVPISRKKTRLRGYNQANSIARGFCHQSKDEILELKNQIVVKMIDTIPQAKITNRSKRLKNVQGVFKIKNKDIIKDRTIIVIDDVTTTGGTITEIIKILKKSGAKYVVGFAIAH